MTSNNSVFSLLQQEGYLTRSSFLFGLRSLSTANLNNNVGHFYTAFFQLSIGLERLMKLTLILDFMANNQLGLPDNKWLKEFGHDLVSLAKSIKEIGQRNSDIGKLNNILEHQSIEFELLSFLSSFAKSVRYANLDALTGKQNVENPLILWNQLVVKIYKNDLSPDKKQKFENMVSHTIDMLQANTVVMFNDFDGMPLSLEEKVRKEAIFPAVAPYIIWHIMKIIHPLYKVMDDVCSIAQNKSFSDEMIVPTMYEFFIDFISVDFDEVLDLVEQWINE